MGDEADVKFPHDTRGALAIIRKIGLRTTMTVRPPFASSLSTSTATVSGIDRDQCLSAEHL